MIEAQRTLEDAKKAYERIAAKYARAEMRLKEDYTKLEETLADAEKNLINKAEALVKEARENLQNVRAVSYTHLPRFFSARIISFMSLLLVGSRPLVGSSRKRISGLWTRAFIKFSLERIPDILFLDEPTCRCV